MTKDQMNAGLLALSLLAACVCLLTGHKDVGIPMLTLAFGQVVLTSPFKAPER